VVREESSPEIGGYSAVKLEPVIGDVVSAAAVKKMIRPG
jgi:hypothetical protein